MFDRTPIRVIGGHDPAIMASKATPTQGTLLALSFKSQKIKKNQQKKMTTLFKKFSLLFF